jgi:hypothetical protein
MSFCFSVRFWVAASGAALALFGCTSPQSTTVRADGRLRVSPQEFTTDVGCRFSSGDEEELGLYAATLIDLGTEAVDPDSDRYPRVSGSGPDAPCTSSTAFTTAPSTALVQVGHLYAAIIDGYAGFTKPQLRRSRREGNWTAPRWQWVCGVGGLSKTQVRTLIERVYDLPRLAAPLVPSAPQPDGTAPDAGTSDGGFQGPVRGVDGGVPADGGSAANSSTADGETTASSASPDAATDSSQSSDVTSSDPDTNTDRQAADLAKVLQAAALDDQPEPTLVVAGIEAGMRGCVLLD